MCTFAKNLWVRIYKWIVTLCLTPPYTSYEENCRIQKAVEC